MKTCQSMAAVVVVVGAIAVSGSITGVGSSPAAAQGQGSAGESAAAALPKDIHPVTARELDQQGFYSWVSTTINTFDVAPPPGRKPLLAMP